MSKFRIVILIVLVESLLLSGRAFAQSQTTEPRSGVIFGWSPNSSVFSSLEQRFNGPANLNLSEIRLGVVHETSSGDEWGLIFSRKRVAGSVDLTQTQWFDEPPTMQMVGYLTEPPGYQFEMLSGRVGRAPRGDIYRMKGSSLMAIEGHWYRPIFSVGPVRVGPSLGLGFSWRNGSVTKETLNPTMTFTSGFDVRQNVTVSKVAAKKAYEAAGAPPVLGGIAGQAEAVAATAIFREFEIRTSGGIGFHGWTAGLLLVFFP